MKVPGRQGFTLVEALVSLAILSVLMASLFGLSIGMGDTAQMLDINVTGNDEARRALIVITRELRQASLKSISGVPGNALLYQVAEDTDNNGTVLTAAGAVELSAVKRIGRATTGKNLVMTSGSTQQVLATNIIPDEDLNGNGVLDAAEDANANGMLERGIWFQWVGNAVRVTIQTQTDTRRGRHVVATLTETVAPRNK